MKKLFKITGLLIAGATIILVSCEDIGENLNDVVTTETEFTQEAEFQAILADSYNTLNQYAFWYLAVVENYSDAITIFTHTTGWNNDRHRRTDTHQLNASDQRRFPLGTVWNPVFNGIASVNGTINLLESLPDENEFKEEFLAQARVIRAFHYFLGMDAYGAMPLVTTSSPPIGEPLPSRAPTSEVFAFLESELLEVIEVLPSGRAGGSPTDAVVINRETARAILATLYLNAEVYTGQARWEDCIEQCDEILAIGDYSLAPNYFDLFKVDNIEIASQEMLFVIDFISGVSPGGGIGWPRVSLTNEWVFDRFPNFPYSLFNGPAVQPTFYRRYDDDDLRKTEGFLEGVQTSIVDGSVLTAPNGDIVDHTIDFFLQPSDAPPEANYQGNFNGVRIIKWEPDVNAIGNQQGNAVPFIRLADIMLQKAECLIRLNGPNAVSDDLINQIRARVFNPAKPLSGATLEQLQWERAFELFSEGHRRRDQIRFGNLNEADDFHGPHPESFNLFPIPQDQLDANPNLGQNPGY